jgi:hypothetical protein
MQVQKLEDRINFICPLCENRFEFDQTYGQIGEHHLVNCPNCLANLVTVKKGSTIKLEDLACQG